MSGAQSSGGPRGHLLTRLLDRIQPTGNSSAVIYGELITGATIAAALGSTKKVEELVLIVVATLLIYWIAHGYSDVVGEGLHRGGHLDGGGVWRAIRREWPMLAACLPPLIVLVVAVALGASADLARYLALALITLSLIGYGTRAARQAGFSIPLQIVTAAVHAALGVGIIGLKALLH